jgi:hypothetical protein
MRYIALEEAFSITELDGRQPPPWPENRFSRRSLADWARRLPDFTQFRLQELDAAGIDVQVLSLTVPGLQGGQDAPVAETGGHALRIIYGRIFDRHPSATLILGHMGEFLPFMRSRTGWTAPGILEALIPGRMQSHACTAQSSPQSGPGWVRCHRSRWCRRAMTPGGRTRTGSTR